MHEKRESKHSIEQKDPVLGEKSKEKMAYVYNALETGRVEEKGNLLMVDSALVCTKAWCIIHAIAPSW